MSPEPLRSRLAELIRVASDGGLDPADVLGGASLHALGLDSLGVLRLVDAIEAEFEVVLDPGADPAAYDTVAALAAHVDGLLPVTPDRTSR